MTKYAHIIIAILFTASLLDAKCGVPTTRRNKAVAHRFMVQTGFPHGRPGWVVDHIVPLCKGGPDTTRNMQWQTARAAKEKDKTECQCDGEFSLRKVIRK